MPYGRDYDRRLRDRAGGRERHRRYSVTTDRFIGSGPGGGGPRYDRSMAAGRSIRYGGELSLRGRNRGGRMGVEMRGGATGGARVYGYGPDYRDNRASARYDRQYFSPGPTYGLRDSRFAPGGAGY